MSRRTIHHWIESGQLDRDAETGAVRYAERPRQSGKSTLCRSLFPDHRYISLEAVDARRFALEDPRAFLAELPTGAVIDEVQRAPDLLSFLQGVIDEDPAPGRWILTGSQNFALLQSVSQSLAGRTAVLHLLPLAHGEIQQFGTHPQRLDEVLLTGGYPRILDREMEPAAWLSAYVATYLERDVRSIANVGDLTAFHRFVELCAGRTGHLLGDVPAYQIAVVYGGEEAQTRSVGKLIPWRKMHEDAVLGTEKI